MAKLRSKVKRNAIYDFYMFLDDVGFKADLSKIILKNLMKFYVDNGHVDAIDKLDSIEHYEEFFNEYESEMEDWDY